MRWPDVGLPTAGGYFGPETYTHSFLNKLFWLRAAVLLNFSLFYAFAMRFRVIWKIFFVIRTEILTPRHLGNVAGKQLFCG
jgi:hypothetical protein